MIGKINMKKFGLLIVVVLLVGVLGVFLSPYYTLYQIKSAYENGDYGKVVSYVDLSKIQQQTKTELATRLDTTLTTNPSLLAVSNLMPKIKDKLTDKAKTELNNSIEMGLTADNLQKTLAGEMTSETKKLVGMWAVASDYVDYELLIKDTLFGDNEQALKNQEPIVKERIAKRFGVGVPTETKMRYCGLNCFEVTGGVSGVPIGATLTRVGVVGWKIDEIKLP